MKKGRGTTTGEGGRDSREGVGLPLPVMLYPETDPPERAPTTTTVCTPLVRLSAMARISGTPTYGQNGFSWTACATVSSSARVT